MDVEWASIWRATCKEFQRKIKDFAGSRAREQRGIAENGPRMGLNMESKMQGIPWENEGFRGPVGLWDIAKSQKMDLENGPRVGLNMKSNM